MKKLILISNLFLLSGCSTVLVEKTYSPKGGVIHHDRKSGITSDRRDEAIKMAQDYCAGDIIITSEALGEDFSRTVMRFVCKDQPPEQVQAAKK